MKGKISIWNKLPKPILQFGRILIFLCFPLFSLQAQDVPMLYKEIQLYQKNYTFNELTQLIHLQTGITFSYDASKVTPGLKFKFKQHQIKAVDLLAYVKSQSGIDYRVINPGFIIYELDPSFVPTGKAKKRKKKSKAPEIASKTTIVKTVAPFKLADTAGVQPNKDTPVKVVMAFGDSNAVSHYYRFDAGGFGGGGIGAGSIRIIMPYGRWSENDLFPFDGLTPPGSSKQQPYEVKPRPDVSGFFQKNLLLSLGVTADETYYFNSTLHFGFKFLYVDLSYGVGRFSRFQYGIGASVPLDDHWHLSLEFTASGSFSRTSVYTKSDTTILPPDDSTGIVPPPIITTSQHPILTSSNLNRFSISFSRNVGKNLTVSGGLVLNQLSSRYFSNDLPLDINGIRQENPNPESRFRTLKPLYVLSQTYDPSNTRLTQVWIGFRMSIFYRLNFSGN